MTEYLRVDATLEPWFRLGAGLEVEPSWTAQPVPPADRHVGPSQVNFVRRTGKVNQAAIDLLIEWIKEFGDERAADLDQQRADLRANRLRFQLGIAEICDYEARRELLRKNATRQIANLERLIRENVQVPISTIAIRDAAADWVKLRRAGRPTAPDDAIDGDVIFGSQARHHSDQHVVATENLRHLSQTCNASDWRNL